MAQDSIMQAYELLTHIKAGNVKQPSAPLVAIQKIYASNPKEEDLQTAYAKALLYSSLEQIGDKRLHSLQILEKLCRQHAKNINLLECYAQGLAQYSHTQDTGGKTNSISKLQSIYQEHPENDIIRTSLAGAIYGLFRISEQPQQLELYQRIALLADAELEGYSCRAIYAKTLVLCLPLLDAAEKPYSLRKLRDLYQAAADNEDIAICYAMALRHLSTDEPAADKEKTVETLRSIYRKHPNQSEIQYQYARTMLDLSLEEGVDSARTVTLYLKSMLEKNPDNTQIAQLYASSLVHLSRFQDIFAKQSTLDKLHILYWENPKNKLMALNYAKALYHYILELEPAGKLYYLERIRAIFENRPKNIDLQRIYARAQLHMLGVQSSEQQGETIALLRSMSARYPGNEDLKSIYGRALLLYFQTQEQDGREHILHSLRVLCESNPQNEALPSLYAKALTESVIQAVPEAKLTALRKLEVLYEHTEDNTDIQLYYAQALVHIWKDMNTADKSVYMHRLFGLYQKHKAQTKIFDLLLSGVQNMEEMQHEQASSVEDSLHILAALSKEHPQNEALQHSYAKILLRRFAQGAGQEATWQAIMDLQERYADYLLVQLLYGEALQIQLYTVEASQKPAHVEKIRRHYEQYPENKSLQLYYAEALYHLCEQGDMADKKETLLRLESLCHTHNHTRLLIAYAKALFLLCREPGTNLFEGLFSAHLQVYPEDAGLRYYLLMRLKLLSVTRDAKWICILFSYLYPGEQLLYIEFLLLQAKGSKPKNKRHLLNLLLRLAAGHEGLRTRLSLPLGKLPKRFEKSDQVLVEKVYDYLQARIITLY